MMHSRMILMVAAILAPMLAASAQGLDSLQQLISMQRACGSKTNSAEATLTLTEGARTAT
jgi:hypothetical protein